MKTALVSLLALLLASAHGAYQQKQQPTTVNMNVNEPDWLSVAPGKNLGERMVWIGTWIICTDLTTSAEFVGLASAPAAEVWRQLPAEQRLAVVQTCMTVRPEDIHPTPTPPALLAVFLDGQQNRWVWIGDYFMSCPHIKEDFTYITIKTDPALNSWKRISSEEKNKVMSKCRDRAVRTNIDPIAGLKHP